MAMIDKTKLTSRGPVSQKPHFIPKKPMVILEI